MGKVSYTLRFYRIHDLDLITFMETHEFNVLTAVYSALTAYSKGELFVIQIPPRRQEKQQFKRVYSKKLVLDEENDAKAIEIMNRLKLGCRNNFLKNLLRLYLCNPLSEEFMNDPQDAEWFYRSFTIFREGKKEVQAGKMKAVNRQRRSVISPSEPKTEPEVFMPKAPEINQEMPEMKRKENAIEQSEPVQEKPATKQKEPVFQPFAQERTSIFPDFSSKPDIPPEPEDTPYSDQSNEKTEEEKQIFNLFSSLF